MENPDEVKEGGDYKSNLNSDSLQKLTSMVEPGLAQTKPGDRYQFLRQGYFSVDPDSKPGQLVFNQIVPLRDSWKG